MYDYEKLHASLRGIPMPERMQRLPLTHNGYPTLFFAGVVEGKVDLRCMDGAKWKLCVTKKLCWLCGLPLGRTFAWPIGPMCVVNRVTAEPPSHRDCAEYAMRACPFLTRPEMRRRTAGMPEDTHVAGFSICRNPGVVALWVGRGYTVFRTNAGGAGYLIQLGEPVEVVWYTQGRLATGAEVRESMEAGMPALMEVAIKQGTVAVAEISRQVQRAQRFLPI